jgi:hypothetical protein
MKRLLLLLLTGSLLSSCQDREAYKTQAARPQLLHSAYAQLNQVLIHDIFSPPVASRIYVYSSLAAYEALLPAYPQYQTMARQLKGFQPVPAPETGKEYCYPLASLKAFLNVSKTLTFSIDMYEDFEKKLLAQYQDIMPGEVYERSLAYGDKVSAHVMDYASKDNYKQTRGFRYTVTNASGTWVPTPPGYMDGVEPRWGIIRPLVIDSANQFAPPLPYSFDMGDKKGPYYLQAKECYEIGKNLTPEQKAIADFWDCNPYKINISGHAMFATKKLSPGGHWMGITGLVARKSGADLMRTTESYLMTSLALFDGFISCWHEKYRSRMVRPETVINQYIDKDWIPHLQTPPFPEYTSGHSVVSGASAQVLTALYGDSFAFADSTEISYGLGVRSFPSFQNAAQEASISRLYGGIHFRPALDNGIVQGRLIGDHILKHINTRKKGLVGR